MKNKQIEIILDSIDKEETLDYVIDTFYKPIHHIKNTIARGLKGMKQPIANEDLSGIKTTFMRFELEVDKNLEHELSLLPEVFSDSKLSHEQALQVHSNLKKERELVKKLLNLLHSSGATCQVYDLLEDVLYKSEDRMDVLERYVSL